MDLRVRLVIVAVSLGAMATVAQSRKDPEAAIHTLGHGALHVESELESESGRRRLAKGQYLSYEALARNNIPCGQRGNTYYNCWGHEKANPYNRGCTRATLCKRNTR